MSPTPNRIRPRCNPLLWSQLRPPRPLPQDDLSQGLADAPLAPENKANTSLRVVFHDTKCILEEFSDRLGSLMESIADVKQHMDKANANFADAHDKTLDELSAAVNRSQKGLLDVIGTPAQANILEDIKRTQTSLEDKVGLMQKQLQAATEQQGQILIALASITPLATLLKDVPQQQSQLLTSILALPFQTLLDQIKSTQSEIYIALQHNTETIKALISPAPPISAPASAHNNQDQSHCMPVHPSICTISSDTLPKNPLQNSSKPYSSDPIQNDTSPRKRTPKSILQGSAQKRSRFDRPAALRSPKPHTPPPRTRNSFRAHALLDRHLLKSTSNTKLSHQKSLLATGSNSPVRPILLSKRLFQEPIKVTATPAVGLVPAPCNDPPVTQLKQGMDRNKTPLNKTVNSKPQQPIPRKHQRRILIDENADDVDIDLDWGDMA